VKQARTLLSLGFAAFALLPVSAFAQTAQPAATYDPRVTFAPALAPPAGQQLPLRLGRSRPVLLAERGRLRDARQARPRRQSPHQ